MTIIFGLAACSGHVTNKGGMKHGGDYWQRSDASSAIYQRGPKAQQMLHRDISHCVAELKELRKLGAIRQKTVPAYQDKASKDLDVWEQPVREGSLRAEYLPYHDFEGCIADRGWERVENLPYDVAERARDTYIETLTGQRRRTAFAEEKTREFFVKPTGEWENLND